MMQHRKPSEMFYKFYCNPDGNELAGYRNKLEEEPDFLQFNFFYNAPGIIKRDKCFPAFDACFFKHTIYTDMPSKGGNYKNDPANTHILNFVIAKTNVVK